MDTSRTPKQERSQRRRDALLQAAVELIAEGGPQAVTHRAVAARAGLPSSTAGYFFESIDHLAAEALRVYTAATVEEFRNLAEIAASGRSRSIDRLITAVADHRPQPELALAQAATYIEASRNPALREPVADALDAYIENAEALLRAFGVPRASAAAPMAVALLDGFMLHSLATPDNPPSPKLIADALEALLAGFLVTADERRQIKRRTTQKAAADPVQPSRRRPRPKARTPIGVNPRQ